MDSVSELEEGKKPERYRAAERPPRVLLIEEEALLREAMIEALRRIDVHVEAVASLDAAQELLGQGGHYQAVISDLGLPDHAQRVLEAIPRTLADLPVVLVTGTAGPGVADRARRAGAFRFLRKPVSAHTLREAVREALRTPRPERRP